MADKDKEISYPQKFQRRRAFIEMGRFLIFLVVEAIVAGGFFYFYSGENKGLEFTRTLILAMAAVGGVYGLILATIRAVKLSEQVNTGQEQLFNQQLGQGATLLASDEMPIRQTGIRVLGDLAERTIDESKQVELIMRTIHDFVHANAIPFTKDGEKHDVALGIRTLVSLYKKSGHKVKLEKLVKFRECYLKNLNFKNADLQGANFNGANLQAADFRFAKLQGVNFWGADLGVAKLQGAYFKGADLQEVNLNGANFEWVDCSGVDFSDAKSLTENQVKEMIFEASLLPRLPEDLENSLDLKRRYELKENPNNKPIRYRYFIESDAEWSGKWVDEYLAEIGIINPEDDG